MARKYFGTDGVRGLVGQDPITPEFVLKLAFAAGKALVAREQGHRPMVLIGKDTRISGYMLEAALQAGFTAAGVDVHLTGPLPTPGIAYLTRAMRASAGVMISASHNAYHDNGIKFFAQGGIKLNDDMELAIEALIDQPMQTMPSDDLGRSKRISGADDRYIEFCKSTFPSEQDLHGLKIVVDCANGAGYHVAPKVFHELGAHVISIGCEPNGFNINKNVGATHTETLQQAVLANKADYGVALDGDGDRLGVVTKAGKNIFPDRLLMLFAADVLERNPGAVIVYDVKCTGRLPMQILRHGGSPLMWKTGHSLIKAKMRETEAELAGEMSGHFFLKLASISGNTCTPTSRLAPMFKVPDFNSHRSSSSRCISPRRW